MSNDQETSNDEGALGCALLLVALPCLVGLLLIIPGTYQLVYYLNQSDFSIRNEKLNPLLTFYALMAIAGAILFIGILNAVIAFMSHIEKK